MEISHGEKFWECKVRGLEVGVCTSSSSPSVHPAIQSFEFFKEFVTVVSKQGGYKYTDSIFSF